MKKQTVMDLVQKAIIDSMNYSRKDGSIIFVNTSPHVNAVSFYAWENAWTPDSKCIFNIDIYTCVFLAPTVREAKKLLKPLYEFMKQNPNK